MEAKENINREVIVMKKYNQILSMLAVLLCVTVTGCSSKDNGISPILGDAFPEKITSIEVSSFYNGGNLEPWQLTQEEIEELNAWLSELSLKQRTYAEGKAPNEVWNGGSSYQFNSQRWRTVLRMGIYRQGIFLV